jgi:hypothetical protein
LALLWVTAPIAIVEVTFADCTIPSCLSFKSTSAEVIFPCTRNARVVIGRTECRNVVVDDVTVETGSFNFTYAAENKNAENVIVLHDALEIAKRYSGEWQRLWDESEPMQARY